MRETQAIALRFISPYSLWPDTFTLTQTNDPIHYTVVSIACSFFWLSLVFLGGVSHTYIVNVGQEAKRVVKPKIFLLQNLQYLHI